MKSKYRVILCGLLLLLGVACTFVAVPIVRFRNKMKKLIRNTPPPTHLSDDEISVIESVFGVVFPPSSSQIRAHFSQDGEQLYCFVEFDQNDLEDFMSGHEWASGGNTLKRAVETFCQKPLRKSTKGFFATEPIEWWAVSKERVHLVSRTVPVNDLGGSIVILIEKPTTSKVDVYLTMRALRSTFPAEFGKIFPISRIGWDLRDSKPYPKKREGSN